MTEKIRTLQKIHSFVDIAKSISQLSTSSRLKVGAIAVHKQFQKIASFGYNGNYAGAPISEETGTEEESNEPGKDGFIHAEINLIAKFREDNPKDYIVILTHSPCKMCSKVLINAGFRYIYWIEEYRDTEHLDIFCENKHMFTGNIDDLCQDYEYICKL